MDINSILNAEEARKITDSYLPKENIRVIENIGEEIYKIAKNGGSTLFISEIDTWFQYFNIPVKNFFECLGYKISYQYGGVDGNYWIISW